ncbi:MAG: hypothetical protein WBL45_08205 [Solirubrobacterales bacterium]
MSSEIFVFTAVDQAARDHCRRTIERAVPVKEISGHEPGIGVELADLGLESTRCWGSVPGAGNLRSWERMRVGHWALLYTGGGRFPFLLKLAHKARSKVLADQLWDRSADDKIWELMFFFSVLQPVELDIAQVRESLGYDESWWPQGLQYPTPEHQETLLEKFGSIEAFASIAGGAALGNNPDRTLNADEVLLGREFGGVPTRPPKPREHRQPSNPDVAGRGYLAHEETVAKLAGHVGPGFRKGTPGINHDGGWEVNGAFSITEVKSINSTNEVGQLQKGLGQLLHNRFKAERNGIKDVTAYLIAEKEPTNSALWRALAGEHGVVFSWPARFSEDIARPM